MGRPKNRRSLPAGWCPWGDRPCVASCPVDAVDNHGNHYPGCASFRLKTQAEIDAMCKTSPLDGLPIVDDRTPARKARWAEAEREIREGKYERPSDAPQASHGTKGEP